jgi:Fuc2NAc and GlcNAc transferase
MFSLVLLLSIFGVAAGLTYAVREISKAQKIFDVPNARSSHSAPVPRGGGVAIVAVFFLTLSGAVILGQFPTSFFYPMVVGGGLVGLVGFIDDRKPVSALLRGLVHLLAAASVAAFFPSLTLSYAVVWTVAIAWSTNLYNFMDGIDGLAASQAVFVCSGLALIAAMKGDSALELASLSLAAASAGFLVLNWSPATLFMGDVGSGFLGVTLATLALWGDREGSIPLFSFLILMSVFIGDASWTLFQRLVTGQRIFEAHRSHAYQKAVIAGRSHRNVVGFILFFNVFWLLPLALLVVWVPSAAWPALIAAYAPVLGAANSLNAGRVKA